ncbi:MAG: hypothetical protein KME57_07890 [Scytonema hyalinum WJT4-NPBG1]|nr:hypothetical protein [Scytonema hyalinum WJT4-NPBG1]
MNSTSRSDACGLVGDLNPPPTLMPTARLTTNGPIGVVFPPTMKLITDN